MTIVLRAIDNLDDTQVLTNLALLTQFLQEAEPTLDTRLGPLRDLILYLSSVFATQRQQQLGDYLRVRSLTAINADPTLADSDAVDAVLSNFRLTRQLGTAATGTVTLVLTVDTTVIIAKGATFVANGRTFAATATFTAKRDVEQVIASADRLLRAVADDHFAFDITVTDTAPGVAGQLAKDTNLVPAATPPAFVAAYAAADFSGGADTETTVDLLARLLQGAAAKTISNRITMAAFLRAVPAFSRIVTSSIIGYGDVEMTRDQHWIWPVSGGGRIDWYVRTAERVSEVLFADVSARLIEKNEGVGIWQFSVDRNVAPGFYEVKSIVPAGAVGADSYEIVNDIRGVDLSRTNLNYMLPDILYVKEATYSRFQSAVIQFRDTDTLTASMDTGYEQNYDVTLLGLPLLAGVQDTVSSRDYASYGADILVRAPIPCFVALAFTLYQPPDTDDPDLDAIKAALCTTVNRTEFTGQLFASGLATTIHALLPAGVTIGSIAMSGWIRRPDGTTTALADTEVLTIPDEPSNAVTRRTALFFAAPADITITVTAVAASASA